ncbi:MAG: YciI family protein [Acidobacteriia bacterium]|nr:YciI family protein [Terriglobia bacterium]
MLPTAFRTLLLAVLMSLSALAQSVPVRQFLLRIEPVRKDFTLQNMNEDERRIAGEHVAYLQSLMAEEKLTFAGQVLDPKGLWGIIIVNAPDQEAANALLNGDPTIKAKMFRGEAIPFRTVFARAAPASPKQ